MNHTKSDKWQYIKDRLVSFKEWCFKNPWNIALIFVVTSYLIFLSASIDHIGFTFQQSEAPGSALAIMLGRSIGFGIEVMLVVSAFAIVIKRSRALFATLKEYRINKGKKIVTGKSKKAKAPELIIAADNSTKLLWGSLIFFATVNLFSNFYFYMYQFKMDMLANNMQFPPSVYPETVITLADIQHIDLFVMFTEVYAFSIFLPVVSLLMVEIIKFVVEQKAIKDMYILMEDDENERQERLATNKKNREIVQSEKQTEKIPYYDGETVKPVEQPVEKIVKKRERVKPESSEIEEQKVIDTQHISDDFDPFKNTSNIKR